MTNLISTNGNVLHLIMKMGNYAIEFCPFVTSISNLNAEHIFTAHIRRIREGNSFSLFVSPHPGGYPHPVMGTPCPEMGYPSSWDGVPPWPGPEMKYPLPCPGMGYPLSQVRMGYPRSWDGVSPGQASREEPQDGGYSLSWDKVPPSQVRMEGYPILEYPPPPA